MIESGMLLPVERSDIKNDDVLQTKTPRAIL